MPCTPDGYVIGDVILFALGENEFNLVGRAPALNWVTYHAETGGYDVELELDLRTALRTGRAPPVVPLPAAGAERHAGHREGARPGSARPRVLPHDDGDDRRQDASGRCATAWSASPAGSSSAPGRTGRRCSRRSWPPGEEFGLRQAGGRAYSSNTVESGWIPSPLPAVYSGESLKAYREWLPAAGYEGSASVGGSFVSDEIEDYYFTPWDLGYGSYVKFDHDFIGREALERMPMTSIGRRSRSRSTTRT